MRTPTPAAVRARALLTADPKLPTAAVLSQLASEGMQLSPASVRIIARAVGRPADSERIPATREILIRLAASVGYAELANGEPRHGWRQDVAERLGVSSSFLSRAWANGVAPATRTRWAQINLRAVVDAVEQPR